MKLLLGILAAVAAVVAVLFLVFKLVGGAPQAATSVSGATAPGPGLPPPATDKTAQRISAGAQMVSALASGAAALGVGKSSAPAANIAADTSGITGLPSFMLP